MLDLDSCRAKQQRADEHLKANRYRDFNLVFCKELDCTSLGFRFYSTTSGSASWGLARVTVRKYLDQPVPVRKVALPRVRPVWEAVASRVQVLLAESGQWTGGKQQLTATRLHALLVAEGHRVVHRRPRRGGRVEAAAPRGVRPPTYRPGDLAEVDFFEVLIDVAGVRRKAWLFLLRLMYSGRDFGWIYERQDQVSSSTAMCAPSRIWAVCPRACLRQSTAGGDADPGWRRAHADAAVHGARLALSPGAVLLSAG